MNSWKKGITLKETITNKHIFQIGGIILSIFLLKYAFDGFKQYDAYQSNDNYCIYVLKNIYNFSSDKINSSENNKENSLISKYCFIQEDECKNKFKYGLENQTANYNTFRDIECRSVRLDNFGIKKHIDYFYTIFPIEILFKLFILLVTAYIVLSYNKLILDKKENLIKYFLILFSILLFLGIIQKVLFLRSYFISIGFSNIQHFTYFDYSEKIKIIPVIINLLFLSIFIFIPWRKIINHSKINKLTFVFAFYVGSYFLTVITALIIR